MIHVNHSEYSDIVNISAQQQCVHLHSFFSPSPELVELKNNLLRSSPALTRRLSSSVFLVGVKVNSGAGLKCASRSAFTSWPYWERWVTGVTGSCEEELTHSLSLLLVCQKSTILVYTLVKSSLPPTRPTNTHNSCVLLLHIRQIILTTQLQLRNQPVSDSASLFRMQIHKISITLLLTRAL